MPLRSKFEGAFIFTGIFLSVYDTDHYCNHNNFLFLNQMRFLAILQIVCILFLSSYSGQAKTLVRTEKMDCCKKLSKATNCKKEKDDCTDGKCTMLLTCGICGFLTVEPTRVKAATFVILQEPVISYHIGNAAGYFPSDWKPPKV